MAELRKILADIENNPITEGIGKEFADAVIGKGVKDLAKQEAKVIIKQLGEEVTVNAIRRMGKKKIEREVELVLKKIPDQDAYQIIKADGKPPKQGQDILSAQQVAGDVEKAVEAGRKVTLSGELTTKANAATQPAREAAKNAETMSDATLEKLIADDTIPAVQRKAYAEELAKRKASNANTPSTGKTPAEEAALRAKSMDNDALEVAVAKGEGTALQQKAYQDELRKRGHTTRVNTDPAAQATKNAENMSDDALEVAVAKREGTPLQQKANEAELQKRNHQKRVASQEPEPKTDAPKVDAPKTADDVLQAKKTAAAEAEAKAAIDAGEVRIKEADLLPAKPGETASERLKRTLEEKPGILDKWDNLKGTKGEEGFWQYIKRRKVATLITALAVAAAIGVYNNTSDPEEINDPEEVDNTNTADAEADAAKKAEADAAKKAEADAAKNNADDKNQAEKTTSSDEEGDEEDSKSDQAAETEASSALKSQIDALIAELSKSKDPAIQKRLAAVRKKLGQSNQGASTSSSNEPYAASGWYDIGRGYRRWYGPDGVDPKTGRKINTGTTDIIPIDDRQRDKYDNMSQSDLASMARKNAGASAPAKTKSQW
jgi:hypothetical protein